MKTLFEELGDTYTQQGDYRLADIKLLEQPEYEIGVWGAAPSAVSERTPPYLLL